MSYQLLQKRCAAQNKAKDRLAAKSDGCRRRGVQMTLLADDLAQPRRYSNRRRSDGALIHRIRNYQAGVPN